MFADEVFGTCFLASMLAPLSRSKRTISMDLLSTAECRGVLWSWESNTTKNNEDTTQITNIIVKEKQKLYNLSFYWYINAYELFIPIPQIYLANYQSINQSINLSIYLYVYIYMLSPLSSPLCRPLCPTEGGRPLCVYSTPLCEEEQHHRTRHINK